MGVSLRSMLSLMVTTHVLVCSDVTSMLWQSYHRGITTLSLVVDDTTCQRCEAGWYCIGDGERYPCGRCDPPVPGDTCGRSATEHSYGAQIDCGPCPDGWVRLGGGLKITPNNMYVWWLVSIDMAIGNVQETVSTRSVLSIYHSYNSCHAALAGKYVET